MKCQNTPIRLMSLRFVTRYDGSHIGSVIELVLRAFSKDPMEGQEMELKLTQ